jgi:serine/threonine protein kinase
MAGGDKADVAADIGDEALEFASAADRDAFIEKECAGDPELARRVRDYIAGIKLVLETRNPPAAWRKAPQRLAISVLQGRYKLLQLLGAGGMGRVFKAIDIKTGDRVAVKLLGGSQAFNENLRISLVREARAASRLHHSNIVRVYDIGQFKGILYIVMEYVRGTAMSNVLRFNLTLKFRLAFMAQVADTLGYAHDMGVVHRDVKPGNILIQRNGTPKILDFGIADHADLPNSLDHGAGTVPYMSPEHFAGQTLDPRSDIWATGVTLFEFLTGNLPYRSVEQISSAPPPTLPEQFPFSHELNGIFARALAKRPDTRYQHATELASELRRLEQACDPDLCSAGLQITSVAGMDFKQSPRDVSVPPRPAPMQYQDIEYALPDLNFSRQVGGNLTSVVRTHWWHDKRELLRAWLSRSSGRINGLVNRLEPSNRIRGLLSPRYVQSVFALIISALLLMIDLVTILAVRILIAFCHVLEITEVLPKCHSCRLRMKRTAGWTRLVKSREEVIFGYRDCLAALKSCLWGEAAKLLSIHGFEGPVSGHLITPARYHLDFYECSLCSNHVARFTMDEIVEDKWVRQPQFTEVDWGDVARRPSLLSILRVAPMSYLRIFSNLSERRIKIRFSVPQFVTGAAAVVVALISINAMLNYRESDRAATATADFKKQFEKRLAAQTAALGTEAAVRRIIQEFRTGTPNYGQLSPDFVETIRRQLPEIQEWITGLGALQSVWFERVSRDGADVYQTNFEKGSFECLIWIGQDGKTKWVAFK